MTTTALLAAWALSAYLIGSIPFGYLIGKMHGIDVRQHGSLNIGATNVTRVLGHPWGIIVFSLDFLKGYLPSWITSILILSYAPLPLPLDAPNFPRSLPLIFLMSSFFLPIGGHVASIFLNFKGGKAVATTAGVLAYLSPTTLLTTLLLFVIVFYSLRIISIASLLAALWMPIGFGVGFFLTPLLTLPPLLSPPAIVTQFPIFFIFVLTWLSLLIVFRHRSNIKRLFQGSETSFK